METGYRICHNNDFKKMIGGIPVNKEEKEINLAIIKEAIIKNNNGIKTNIEREVFAKSYPESLNYVKEYYDSLLNVSAINSTGWKNHRYTSKEKSLRLWKRKLENEKKITIMIYAPILVESDSKLKEYVNTFGITLNDISNILNHYKLIESETNLRIKNLKDDNTKYKMAKIIANEVFNNNMRKEDICKKYKIGTKAFDSYINLLKEIDEKEYNKLIIKLKDNDDNYYQFLSVLVEKLGNYINKGIEVREEKIPFTMLDYYCITKITPNKLLGYIKRVNFTSKEESINKSYLTHFLNKNKNVGPFVTTEKLINQGIVFIIKDKIIEIDENISDEVLELLSKEQIPLNHRIVYSAFQRYARGYPILPLKENELKKEQQEESTKNKKR